MGIVECVARAMSATIKAAMKPMSHGETRRWTDMEQIKLVLPFLWELIGRHRKSKVNVTTKENEIIVSIWSGLRWKRFKNTNPEELIKNIRLAFSI